jgi:hypothetical protein
MPHFVTEEQYKNAVATIEIAIRNGQVGSVGLSLAIGKLVPENMHYDTVNAHPTRFCSVAPLSDFTFKSEQNLRDTKRKEHEDKLKRLQEEISRKSKEMEEIGKKLGDL